MLAYSSVCSFGSSGNFPEVQHSNRTSKQSSTKQGVGRATPEVRGVNSLWEEYTPLPEMV